ncbi:MAG: cyclopropane fatty acyl phospholipid synthase [Patescibacteria group bacterium]|nr:cyclopropane fatty acyl phospholipid synthase [Patescibacteria group bacterium]
MKKIAELLASADIKINGNRAWDIQIHNPKLFARVLSKGTLGLGEAYMDGWWDCKALDQFIDKILRAQLDKVIGWKHLIWLFLKACLVNLQSEGRAYKIGEHHYDIGNDLYQRMLDKYMTYTCGFWDDGAKNLNEAQMEKLDLVCRKIGLQPGMKVLDIGCGWGSFAKFAAEKYGAKVVGITVSKEQAELGKKMCAGLPIELRLQDYRQLKGQFDRVVSLGMIEHVGHKNYRDYMEVAHRCLKESGLFLLHTIGSNNTVFTADAWVSKYIFPNGHLPSIRQIGKSIEKLFVMEDWQNFGANYDKTLIAWHDNFANAWDELKKLDPKKYTDRFYRMWSYYLLTCAGAFRARDIQLWQIILSPHGVDGGYKRV